MNTGEEVVFVEKNLSHMNFRISKELKRKFYNFCYKNHEIPANKLRQLMREYVENDDK